MILGFVVMLSSCNKVSTKDRPLAKVGDTYLYESELDFAISSMPPFRQNMMKETKHRRELFQNLLQTRVYSVAGRKWVSDPAGKIGVKISQAEERDLARIYQQIHIGQNLGFTEAELQKYFKANKSQFQTDSTQVEFKDARTKVAEAMFIEKEEASYREFFEKNKQRFAEKNSAEISVIQNKNESVIKDVATKLASGISFDTLAKQFSEEKKSAIKGGNLGWVRQGEYKKELWQFC
jgi:parvulin-like peptidyl-prolyl isomerase